MFKIQRVGDETFMAALAPDPPPIFRKKKHFSSDLRESQDQVWRQLGGGAVAPFAPPRGDANAKDPHTVRSSAKRDRLP